METRLSPRLEALASGRGVIKGNLRDHPILFLQKENRAGMKH